jgi:hypothetical protein
MKVDFTEARSHPRLQQEGFSPRQGSAGINFIRTLPVSSPLYRMDHFQNVYTWKEAYHLSADFAH